MKRNLFMIGFLLSLLPCHSWELSSITGGRASSVGHCSVSFHDFWSIENNPAGLAKYPFISVGISYENRFLLKELSNIDAAFVIPVKIGTFGLSFNRFGFENYNENKIGLSYARAFGPYLKMGLQLDYLSFKFSDDYVKRRTVTFGLGLQSDITNDLCLGVYIFNPVNVSLKTLNNERVPIVFRFGFTYKMTKDFTAATEIEYDSDKNLDYRIGLEYNILKDFFIRVGVHTRPATACFGIGYEINRVVIDVAATMNQYTGVSFQSSLIFKIKEVK